MVDLQSDATTSAAGPAEGTSTSIIQQNPLASCSSNAATSPTNSSSQRYATPPGLTLSGPSKAGVYCGLPQAFLVLSEVQQYKVEHFPQSNTVLEEGMVAVQPGCKESRRRGIHCTFGAGVTYNGKRRDPTRDKCDFCKLWKTQCVGNGFKGHPRRKQEAFYNPQPNSVKPLRDAQDGSVQAEPADYKLSRDAQDAQDGHAPAGSYNSCWILG